MNPYIEKLANRRDEELIDLLAHPDDYHPEAVEAAEAIIHARELDPDLLLDTLSDLKSRRAARDEHEDEPLTQQEMLMYILFPFIGLIGWGVAAMHYHQRGQRTKRDSVAIYLAMGVLLWAGVIFLLTQWL
ncbi:hypothetical protein [Pontibacter sp. G13]|uniref:hypothetical protein n=1 Tax=Pontibacter sp. G13 TaxID=3074898 RepID=UPI00288B99EC|nr:hypothetical protein [Pontibacter sp. G13]WNJ17397.1 hypothetical protein RJD25_21320 [Pontibacter sp. G13]